MIRKYLDVNSASSLSLLSKMQNERPKEIFNFSKRTQHPNIKVESIESQEASDTLKHLDGLRNHIKMT